MQQKNIKLFIFPIVALFTFVMLIFGAAYAYLSGIINMNTANYQVTLPTQTSLVCTKTDCGVTVTPAMMLNTNTGSTAKTSSTCSVNCTCSGTPGAVCLYNVTLMSIGVSYYPSDSLSTNKEFTVNVVSPTGCSAQNGSGTETQVNSQFGKVMSSCSLTVPDSGSVSANVTAEFKWYNLNLNQDSHIGLSYQYYLTTDTLLPSEYQQVEYIKMYETNARTSYILTNYALGDISSAKIMYSYENFAYYNRYSEIILRTEDTNSYAALNGQRTGGIISITPQVVNTESIKPTEFTISMGGSATSKLLIGGWTDNYWTPAGKYYYVRFFDRQNVLVFNGIPCYRKSDSIAGLYDIVEGVFYPSNGTNNFAKGPDI